jgi:arylsulfatase A-like enzyme
MVGGKAALWDDYTMSDVLVEEARKYIAKQKNDKPFFLYFPSQAIHTPRTPNKRFQGKTELGPRGDSMVEFDWKVGEIMKALKEKGVLENTIVVLSSDNGPVYIDGYADGTTISRKTHPGEELDRGHDGSAAYRGGKYMPHDGGTRVPFVVSWPDKIKPGVSHATVGQIDFLASFAALLDIAIPEGQAKDSRNLLPVFMGESDKGVEYLLQGFKAQKALRYKNWKYIPGRKKAKEPEQLYNLELDVGEQNNLVENNPEMTQHMRDMLNKILTADAIRDFE